MYFSLWIWKNLNLLTASHNTLANWQSENRFFNTLIHLLYIQLFLLSFPYSMKKEEKKKKDDEKKQKEDERKQKEEEKLKEEEEKV